MPSEPVTEISDEPTSLAPQLGARIRAARTRRRLSVADLADSAQVSKSLVSQIERGVAAPSLETLRRLASALDLPVFALFLDGADNRTVVRAHRRRAVSYPGSAVTREILSPGLRGRMVLLWVTFPPGEQSGPQPVHHAGEECVVVIRGALDVLAGEDTIRLDAGDSVTFDSALPHVFRNPLDGPTEIVVAISPPNI